jgi:predicted transcriptional regulator
MLAQNHSKTSPTWEQADTSARRSWAESVIAKHQIAAPVNVAAIARDFGINVFQADLGSISGILRKDDNSGPSGFTIYVNKSHKLNRQRFTVAHEFGHFVLHSSFVNSEGGIQDDEFYRALSGPQETQANYFAADVLMPWSLINQLQAAGNKELPTLAQQLGVSKQALAIRLGLPYDATDWS